MWKLWGADKVEDSSFEIGPNSLFKILLKNEKMSKCFIFLVLFFQNLNGIKYYLILKNYINWIGIILHFYLIKCKSNDN